MSLSERSPRFLLGLTVFFLLMTELLVMGLLAALPPLPPVLEALADALLLTLASLPVFYYLLFLPLTGLLAQQQGQEEELRRHRDRLEETVQHRTADLSAEILQHRKTEETLREQGELQRQITDAISEALIILDHEGLVIFWNPAAEVLSGHDAGEALGRKLEMLLTPKPRAEDMQTVQDLLSGRGAHGFLTELAIRRRDGSGRILECSFTPLRDGTLTLVVLRDITDRRHADRQREDLQRQLRQSQKMEAIGALAGGIAHDFNNILTAILGFTDLAMAGTPPASPLRDDLGSIRTAGLRARELVRQILAFCRRGEQEAVPVQPSLIAKEVLKLLRPSLPASIDIRQDIDPNSGYVAAAPSLIHQILLNLCTNAKQAMGEKGGTLTIRLCRCAVSEAEADGRPELEPGDYILLIVSDTGCGMEPDLLAKIFEPYFTTKAEGEGTGMGLAVVKGIVSGMRGAIQVESAVGQGTTFRVYLPVMTASEAAGGGQEGKTFVSGTGRILLIDDEDPLVRMFQRLFEMLGYQPTIHTGSLAALEYFKAHPDDFDLVITDYMMPSLNGLELAAAMKKIRPALPILMMTGFRENFTEEEARRRGVDLLVFKPVVPSELSQLIHALLTSRSACP